ncbi:hypothetical protein WJX72_005022 [[Myrmecia] bisecta]|uniref:Uncharacterized protein n=1 Tax=[Myrmecia] bisecta TaxID=41462 RepID=A0AAW1QF92_9CHLO
MVSKANGVRIALITAGIVLLPAVRSTSSGLSKIAAGLTSVGSALAASGLEGSPSLDVSSVTEGFVGISRGLFSVGKGLQSAAPGFHHMGSGLDAIAPSMRHVGDGCASVGSNLGQVSRSFQDLAAGLNHLAAALVGVGLAYVFAIHGIPALAVGIVLFLSLVLFLRMIMARGSASSGGSSKDRAPSSALMSSKRSKHSSSQTVHSLQTEAVNGGQW